MDDNDDASNPPPGRLETIRPVAGDPPLSAFIQKPKVGMISVVVVALLGVLAAMLWMLRPLPVHVAEQSAGVGASASEVTAFGTQRALVTCKEKPNAGSYVELTVTPEGVVSDAQAVGPFATREGRECVLSELRTLRLPAFDGPPRTFRQSLIAP